VLGTEAAENAAGHHPESIMIYEYRVYRCLPGRLPALLKRFENHTTKIWEKHDIKPAGFWTVLIGDGNHDLHYFIAWESFFRGFLTLGLEHGLLVTPVAEHGLDVGRDRRGHADIALRRLGQERDDVT
jgi:hypothetical protein